jgi:DNA-binding transcriptional LysR family regulator
MELRHLEHFLAVAEEGSFTRAAARVHLVQSALSVSVRALERELGTRLFDRTTHRVELSDSGRALVPEARRTLAAAEAARDAVAAVQGGVRGTLRVGIMQALALVDLGELLTRFAAERPEVQIMPRTVAGGSEQLVREVEEGRLDVAFAARPGDYPGTLSVVSLGTEPLQVACPPAHPLSRRRRLDLDALAAERFVEFPPGWGTRIAVDRLFAERAVQRDIAVEVADIPTAVALVRAGLGFAFLAPSTVAPSDHPLLRPVRPTAMFSVSLLAARDLSAAGRAFVDLVAAARPTRNRPTGTS